MHTLAVAAFLCVFMPLFNNWEDHLSVKHVRAEDQLEFRCLLIVSCRAPFDLLFKFFVLCVFLMDLRDELIPVWLYFVNGVMVHVAVHATPCALRPVSAMTCSSSCTSDEFSSWMPRSSRPCAVSGPRNDYACSANSSTSA